MASKRYRCSAESPVILREITTHSNANSRLFARKENEIIVLNRDDLFRISELNRNNKQALKKYSKLHGGNNKLEDNTHNMRIKIANGRVEAIQKVEATPNVRLSVKQDGKRVLGGKRKLKKSLQNGEWEF